jgi:hypothetical protein
MWRGNRRAVQQSVASTSGVPKKRLYSPLNWLGLSYPTLKGCARSIEFLDQLLPPCGGGGVLLKLKRGSLLRDRERARCHASALLRRDTSNLAT